MALVAALFAGMPMVLNAATSGIEWRACIDETSFAVRGEKNKRSD